MEVWWDGPWIDEGWFDVSGSGLGMYWWWKKIRGNEGDVELRVERHVNWVSVPFRRGRLTAG